MAWFVLSEARSLGKFNTKKEATEEARKLFNDQRKNFHPKRKAPGLYEYVAPKEYDGYLGKLRLCTKKAAKDQGIEHLIRGKA